MTYATFEQIALKNERDVKIDELMFRVRGVDPQVLLDVGIDEKPIEAGKATKEDIERLNTQIDRVLELGMVGPTVTRETVRKLGRYRIPLFKAITHLSGLSEKAQADFEFLG